MFKNNENKVRPTEQSQSNVKRMDSNLWMKASIIIILTIGVTLHIIPSLVFKSRHNIYHDRHIDRYRNFLIVGVSISTYKFIEILHYRFVVSTRATSDSNNHILSNTYVMCIGSSFVVFLLLYILTHCQNVHPYQLIDVSQFIILFYIKLMLTSHFRDIPYSFFINYFILILYIIHNIFIQAALLSSHISDLRNMYYIISTSLLLCCLLIHGVSTFIKLYLSWDNLDRCIRETILDIVILPALFTIKLLSSLFHVTNNESSFFEVDLLVNLLSILVLFTFLAAVSHVDTIDELIISKQNLESKNVFVKTISHEIRFETFK